VFQRVSAFAFGKNCRRSRVPASNHGGRARILYLWWYASPGAAADQPGVQDWYIPPKVQGPTNFWQLFADPHGSRIKFNCELASRGLLLRDDRNTLYAADASSDALFKARLVYVSKVQGRLVQRESRETTTAHYQANMHLIDWQIPVGTFQYMIYQRSLHRRSCLHRPSARSHGVKIRT
jgi:hypothetical protein